MKNYTEEARKKWSGTDAYAEYEKKTEGYGKEKWQRVNDGLLAIFASFAECKGQGFSHCSEEAQRLVEELKAYITKNYYSCTDEILSGLGQMYVTDARFRENIDRYGVGTAEYVSAAIASYCK